MCRGILDVTVQVTPVSTLRLVGLHLKSQRDVPEYDEAKFRARESIAVRAHLDAIMKETPDLDLLVFGDLNDSKNAFAVREILGPLKSPMALRDLRLKDQWGLTWTHHWAEADIYSRLDYLLVSHSLWRKVNLTRSGIHFSPEWSQASDHRAIYTQISFPE
jgi:endonuclease/exonuclease/phosphatase family metal-dependent hydrolase